MSKRWEKANKRRMEERRFIEPFPKDKSSTPDAHARKEAKKEAERMVGQCWTDLLLYFSIERPEELAWGEDLHRCKPILTKYQVTALREGDGSIFSKEDVGILREEFSERIVNSVPFHLRERCLDDARKRFDLLEQSRLEHGQMKLAEVRKDFWDELDMK